MGQTRPRFHLFSSFQTHITILQQINVTKCPSSVRCLDSNSQPLEHESPLMTTRPGLPPNEFVSLCKKLQCFFHLGLIWLRETMLRLIQTRRSGLRIPQWTCINAEIGNFLSMQKCNSLPQSAAENADSLNEPLAIHSVIHL